MLEKLRTYNLMSVVTNDDINAAHVLRMVICGWWVEIFLVKVVWRCVSMATGAQSVMTTGTQMMLRWSADSWDMIVVSNSSNMLVRAVSSMRSRSVHESDIAQVSVGPAPNKIGTSLHRE